VHPADVRGRFDKARNIFFAVLVAIFAALPWINVDGRPAVLLNIEDRRFFLFGATFNAQDIWLFFFVLTGFTFGLVYLTAVLGRVWCGWACPQTVFLEGMFRRVERWIEGSREIRLRRNAGPWTVDKVWRKGLTQLVYVALSMLLAHMMVAYFVGGKGILTMVTRSPSEHPETFLWSVGITLVTYVNFSWFREQFCLIVCPYGRLQSIFTDPDSYTVGYDAKRGEPRGKAKAKDKGACVDCGRCVTVCPMGIDIRNGMQLDCTSCMGCIDACDEIMDKLKRPRGLIRFDSLNGLQGNKKGILRPRIVLYSTLLLVGAVVATLAFRKHTDFEANLLRLRGAPYVIEGPNLRNAFEIHVVNKRSGKETFDIWFEPIQGASFVVPLSKVDVEGLQGVRAPVFVTLAQSDFSGDFPVRIHVRRQGGSTEKIVVGMFLGAKAGSMR
jgi:cytochrome c oxidase accessory protein FixG